MISLQGQLSRLEESTKDGYSSYMETHFTQLRRLSAEFFEIVDQPSIGGLDVFKLTSANIHDRLKKLERFRDEAAPSHLTSKEVSTSTAKEIHIATHPLRVDLPTFDGSVVGWRPFFRLFQSGIDKEKHLTTDDKKRLLIKSMETPEAKEKARIAADTSSTFEEVIDRMRESYDVHRDLHRYYLKDLLQPDRYSKNRHDVERVIRRLEKNLKGLGEVNGLSDSQIITSYLEGYMGPYLLAEWKRSSAEAQDTPPATKLLEFLKEFLKRTSTSITIGGEVDLLQRKKTRDVPLKTRPPVAPIRKTVLKTQTEDECYYCNGKHYVFSCPDFRSASPAERREWAIQSKACLNCLKPGHQVKRCSSKHRCKECGERHSTFLHLPDMSDETPQRHVETVNLTLPMESDSAYALPNTAIVTAAGEGLVQRARAQFDNGATASFITKKLATTLKAKYVCSPQTMVDSITGSSALHQKVKLTLIGRKDLGCQSKTINVEAYVVDRIPPTASRIDPKKTFQLPAFKGLVLADPNYSSGATIDLLLDTGVYSNARSGRSRLSGIPSIIADETIFGWTVGGTDPTSKQEGEIHPVCLRISKSLEDPERLLRRFWEVHQMSSDEVPHTEEELQALQHFQDTVHRDSEGSQGIL